MAFLDEVKIEAIVKEALKEVADFSGDFKKYEFKHFHEFHKKVFAARLTELLNKKPYFDRNNEPDYERYYDIALSNNIINSWTTLQDCVNYVYDNHTVKKRNPNKIQL